MAFKTEEEIQRRRNVQVKVERISKGKTQKGSEKTGLFDGTHWYNVLGTHEVTGQTVELEKTNFGKDWYEIKTVVPAQAGAPIGNGHQVRWNDYAVMATLAHELAKQLEPDGVGSVAVENEEPIITVDRSAARAAIINTAMIAFTNGKITLGEGEDDIPF